MRTKTFLALTLTLAAWAGVASAEDAGGSVSLSSDSGADADGDAAADPSAGASNATAASTAPGDPNTPYIHRYPAEGFLFELGLFGGVLLPSSSHNLHVETNPQVPFSSVAPDFGLRAAFFPLSFFGAEVEGAVMPSSATDGTGATLWAFRAHGILQLPFYSITPFVLLGGGGLGAINSSNGDDGDPAFHFGGGVKVAVNRWLSARLDVRDTTTQENYTGMTAQLANSGTQTHHPEILLGLSAVLGRDEPAPPPPDTDGDGILDANDKCPSEAGPAPDGCPPPPDADGDGIIDDEDKCPSEAGPAPEGCPPPKDTDADGFVDTEDKCPDVAGIAPDGCPDTDPDKDGIPDPKDQCASEPETKNGYQDNDGCPDEVPQEVKKFTGVIEGIQFDFGKASIRPGSRKVLDAAAKILIQYADLIVEISGHTDNVGPHEKNVTLSQTRAAAVKDYLVAKGVAEDHIRTRGAGPDEPIESNDTKAGQQKNRRTEFKLLSE